MRKEFIRLLVNLSADHDDELGEYIGCCWNVKVLVHLKLIFIPSSFLPRNFPVLLMIKYTFNIS